MNVSELLRVVACVAVGLAPVAFAQPPPQQAPITAAPVGVTATPPNITRWGITTRGATPQYGKTGERLFIEGRDLNPDGLTVRLSLGSRSATFQRQAGGTSARVEFIIPPDAITGELTAKLQATQGGTQVLSENFGVCDRISIFSISPSEFVLASNAQQDVNGEFSLQGRILSITGTCLQELQYAKNKQRDAIAIGQTDAALIKGQEQSRTFGKIDVVLSTYAKPSAGIESQGPMTLTAPSSGPTIRVGFSSSAPASTPAPTATPKPLVPISITRFESLKWAASSIQPPFVVVGTDPTPLSNPDRPPFFPGQIDIFGDNVAANSNTSWKIGAIDLISPNSTGTSPPAIRANLPANAITAPLCATRSDGAKFCSSFNVPVVAGPRVTTVPAGWRRYGLAEHPGIDTRVRQRVTITGFDLQPQGHPDLRAELLFSNFNPAEAQACDLEPRILSFTAQRIEVSIGTPGGQRPAGCSAEQEQQVSFMRPPSGPIGPGFVQLELRWIHQGTPLRIARWNIHGVP